MYKQKMKKNYLWMESIIIRIRRRILEIQNLSDGILFIKHQYQKYFCRKSIVFYMDAKSMNGIPLNPPAGFSIRKFGSVGEMREEDRDIIVRYSGKITLLEFEKDFLKGDQLWLGYIGHELAGVCWSARRDSVGSYFVSLAKEDITIRKCFVVSKFRKRGIYSSMLKKMTVDLAEEGIKQIFIDCKVWNIASRRGILKAGFKELGSGTLCSFQFAP
jgi:RimJ/RimL family protein N-acetyltransferase